jgi:uncharacterized protein (DUF736 family)
MKKSDLISGEFTKTEHGFTGKLDTLAIKAHLTLQPNDDKEQDSHPDFIVLPRAARDRRRLGTLGCPSRQI